MATSDQEQKTALPYLSVNVKILLSTTAFSILLWAVFTILGALLTGRFGITHQGHFPFTLILLVTGGVIAGLFIIHAANKRCEVERALRENDARLKKMQEIAHLGSWELEVASGRLIWSDEVFHIFGLHPQEFTPTYENFLDAVHPDDRVTVNMAYSDSLRQGKDNYEIEHRIIRRHTGEVRFVHERCEHFRDASGLIVRSVGMVQDITERKKADEVLRESEGKLRAITNNIPDTILQCDRAGRITYVNRLYPWLTKDQVLSSTLFDFISREDRSVVEKALHAAFVDRVASVYESSGPGPDGGVRTYEVCASPIFIGNEVGSAVLMARDITARKTAELMVRDMQRRESIGILSGGIAHDFNNLLGVMLGNVSLAQEQLPADHPAVKNIGKAISAMERATHLTRQMLAYSGKGKFQILKIDVASVIKEHVSLFTVSLPKNVKLAMQLPSSPVYVNGDSGQIEQIVMNLIINGGDAIGDRQGCVSVTLAPVSLGREELVPFGALTNTTLCEGNYALLEVSDTGIGMNADTMTKMFDPFFTTKFTGRGLGLSAVLGIIQGHKGGITVTSTEGVGTAFRIILPLAAAPEHVEERPSPDHRHNARATSMILVIDDEEDIATMAQEMLNAGRYQAAIELYPVKAIEYYKQHRSEIGLVLVDLTMPEMSGKEVVDALHHIDPNVKIILSSGYSKEEVTEKIGDAKISAFIQKPYRLQSLLKTVQSVME